MCTWTYISARSNLWLCASAGLMAQQHQSSVVQNVIESATGRGTLLHQTQEVATVRLRSHVTE